MILEPPEDGSLARDERFRSFIERLRTDWPDILRKGAFVFDIDETLLAPDASLHEVPLLREEICRLLKKGMRIALISGGPGAVVERRIAAPLAGETRRFPGLLKSLTLYVNGGSSRLFFLEDGTLDEDAPYAERHRIPAACVLETGSFLEAEAARHFGLPPAQFRILAEAWRCKRNAQWAGCPVSFDDSWIEGKPWKVSYWSDRDMAEAKSAHKPAAVSFPFINTRGELCRNGKLLSVSGFSPSGFYDVAFPEGGDGGVDIRSRLVRDLERHLAGKGIRLSMKKAGRSTIDITAAGTDKASALKHYMAEAGLEPRFVLFWGDEFYEGGNDYPVLLDPELRRCGLTCIALNRHRPPSDPCLYWAGRSVRATHDLLSFLNGDAAGHV